MQKEYLGYVPEEELETLISEENLAGGTTWGCVIVPATITVVTAGLTALVANTGTTNACTKSCKKL